MRLFLPAIPPFSLLAVAESHGWSQLAPFSWSRSESASAAVESACAERAERGAAGGVLARVEQLGTGRVVELRMGERDGCAYVDAPDDLATAESQEVVHKVEWMLQLGQDLSAFYALAEGEPRLAHLERSAKGRILRSPTLFEDVVKTILTTNVRWSGTVRMAEALVERFGAPLPADPARCAFPTPDRLAAANEASLRSVGLGYRAPYVLDLACSVVSGARDLEALKRLDSPTAQLRQQLLAIKGVGDYAAASILMLLGRYDFLPVDSWARTMVSREWYGGSPVGRTEVEAAFERWGIWKGLAYWFWDWRNA